MNITMVTVTYGARAHLLVQVLDAAKAQGIAEAVVVDNGATEPVEVILAAKYGAWVLVHKMGGNKGSAAGFAAGIQQAKSRPASYILLLDDDNVMAEGCLAALIAAFKQEAKTMPLSRLLGFGFRVGRHQWMIDQRRDNKTFERRSSFRSFHVLDIAGKLKKRLGYVVPSAPEPPPPPAVYIGAAAYGGMFFHKALLEAIGQPDERFFLYEDDIEYSRRVIENGGRIFMVTGARINECDISWNHKITAGTSFARWLDSGARTRRYYAFRNGTYNDFYRSQSNRFIVFFNMVFYMSLLLLYALFTARLHEFGLLNEAMRDGITGRLDKRLSNESV